MPFRLRKMASTIDSYKMLFAPAKVAGLLWDCAFIFRLLVAVFLVSSFLHVGFHTEDCIGLEFSLQGPSLFLGFVLGFIFCVPRIPKQSARCSRWRAFSRARLRWISSPRPNQIRIWWRFSDWLTKMLVGVGPGLSYIRLPHF